MSSVKVVIAPDLRQRVTPIVAAPQNNIGQVYSVWPTVTGYGTGTLIAPDYVLTCAHNVYSSNGQAQQVTFTLGLDGANSIAVSQATPILVFADEYKSNIPPNPDPGVPPNDITAYLYDVALLQLTTPMNAPPVQIQIYPEGVTAGSPGIVTGYPGDKAMPPNQMWQAGGPLNLDNTEEFVTYLISTYAGQSGAPVWYQSPNLPYLRLVGIHVSGILPPNPLNFGVYVTADVASAINGIVNA